ncbi:MAG: DUF4252 domain-containing protein [Bacteroidales bacterium]
MKRKIIFCLTVFSFLIAGCRPEEKSGVEEEIFRAYEGQKGVIIFSLPPGLFALAVGEGDTEIRDLMREVEKVRIILIDRGAGKDPEGEFMEKLAGLGFEDLVSVNDGNNRVHLKIFQPEEVIREVMLLTSSDDTFLGISMAGNISREHLSALVKQVQINDFKNMK